MSWVETTAAEFREVLGEENVLIEGDWIVILVNGERFVIMEDEALKLMRTSADAWLTLMDRRAKR